MSDRAPQELLPAAGWVLLCCALALSMLGIVGIYAGEMNTEAGPANTLRQVAYLAAALIAFVAVNLVGTPRIMRWSYWIFGAVLVLLVVLVVARKVPMEPLIRPRRNTYRWIEAGPIQIQVSELAKIAMVLALAWYLRFKQNHRTLIGLIKPLGVAAITMLLVLVEPDLGTALLFLPTCLVMLFAAGARLRHMALLIGLVLAAAPIFYFSPFMSEYQKQRVRVLLRQNDRDAAWQMSAGYQLRQSKIAIGSGRFIGRDLDEGAFFRHKLLPEDHNDFIFAVLGYQWGFLGTTLIVSGYLLFFVACLYVASSTHDPFGRLTAVGLGTMLWTQTVINIGMTIGLLPITGMTLPFVSFGGSGLLTNYAMVGLIASAGRHRPIPLGPRAFEFFDEET